MKKLAIGLFLILGLSVFAEGNKIEVRGGYDFGAKYDVDDIWDGGDAKAGTFEIGSEYRYEVYPGVEVGGGIAYQSHKKIKNGYEAYNSVPVYLTTKYTFNTGMETKPYLKADLCYSFNTNKANNGMYYGAGVGVSYNNFNVDLMYKENKSKINGWLWDSSLNYKRITLGFGYNIPF